MRRLHRAARWQAGALLPAAVGTIGDRAITTIEAIGATESGAKVQKVWLDLEVIQCGYCQSGQIMSAAALLAGNGNPTDADIDAAMAGNICRCGTYVRIRDAIKRAAGRVIGGCDAKRPCPLQSIPFSQSLSRRGVLQVGVAGGLVLALHLPVRAANEPEQAPDSTVGQFAPNAFIRIDHAGKTTLVMPQVEMGQGVYTAVAMILAEELDADFSQVVLEHAPPNDKLYGNPIFGIQVTGNSNSIRAFWKPLRVAGAAARTMLVQAAAAQWKVDPASCSAAGGKVSHAESGRIAAYGDLVDAASALPAPKDPQLKDPKDFTLIGKPLKRLDTPNKTDGKVIYAIDAMLPGMTFATLAQSPVFGGKVAHVDDTRCQKDSGSPASRRA